jgi:hypothetical protein
MYKIQEELIQVGGQILCFDFDELLHSIWNKEELPEQWKDSIIVPIFIKKVMELTVVITEKYPSYEFHTKFYSTFTS